MGVHEFYFGFYVVVGWSDGSAAGGGSGVFGGEDHEAEIGGGREGADVGDLGAGLEERYVGGWVDMSMDVYDWLRG